MYNPGMYHIPLLRSLGSTIVMSTLEHMQFITDQYSSQ